jgi:2,3-bisphosphoglycerate-independent phosphoglycerate mutase
VKYAIVIPDGAADEPQDSLRGQTPLQAAAVPNMDRIAREGAVGLSNNVPPSLAPASDVATLSLFGYDPLSVYTGRAPLEAAAMGVSLGPHDWAVRCNLVTVTNGTMADFTAGHISSAEGAALMEALQEALGASAARELALEFHSGVGYRNLLVVRSRGPEPLATDTVTQPPHDIPNRAVRDFLPRGSGSELLVRLMKKSQGVLAAHSVTEARRRQGRAVPTQIWLWGQGRAPHLLHFRDVYGPRGAIVSAVDLVRGVGALLGWTRVDVAGATGYLDTDYAAKGRAAVAALSEHDLVCVHVEATDEASHEGRADAKVEALEKIDRHVVGPLRHALPDFGTWRILISPDHRTPLRTRAHSHGPVPFAMAGTGITPSGVSSYDEVAAVGTGVRMDRGHELMPRFLGRSMH